MIAGKVGPAPTWVVAMIAALYATQAILLVAYGFASGRWLWGLLYGSLVAGLLYEWLTIRKVDLASATIADRLVFFPAFFLLEMARPAFEWLETL
jgi:hypothetical protein